MKQSHITWRYNNRENTKKKKIHSLSRRERWGWVSEGYSWRCFLSHFCFLLKGPVFAFICRFFTLLYKESNVSLVLQGSMNRPFGTVEVFCFVFFYFPLLNLGSDCWTGVTDWKFGIPRRIWEKVKYGNLLLFKEKKYWWPWTVLIFPNHSWRGEKREATPRPPHSTFSSRGGFWKYNQQKTTNFLVYL